MKNSVLTFFLLLSGFYCHAQEVDELFSTVQISDTIEVYQHLMSSQNYGSNYGIYVKLRTKRLDDSTYELQDASFRLVNYKASILMEIRKVVLDQESIKSNVETGTVKFKIYVQGYLEQKDSVKLSRSESNKQERIVLKRGKLLVSEKYLVPMFSEVVAEPDIECQENYNCIFKKYQNDLGILRYRPYNDYVVDTEFFYADGPRFIKNKDVHDADTTLIDMPASLKGYKNVDIRFNPGPRCKTGYNIMM